MSYKNRINKASEIKFDLFKFHKYIYRLYNQFTINQNSQNSYVVLHETLCGVHTMCI